MVTTIQISTDLQDALNKRKFFNRETYEEVIWDLLEDTMELKEETKKDIEEARLEIEKGNFLTHDEVKKELGI